MRIAALYDIHGNLPALEAVLREVRAADVDRVVIGGDVFPGPMDREALLAVLDLDVPVAFVRGNGESAVLSALAGDELGDLPEAVRTSVRWSAGRLDRDTRARIAAWPRSLRVERPDGDVLFCHATPRSDTEIFTRETPDAELEPIFGSLNVGLVVCGHTHMPFDRTIAGVRVVNAGSVGMPFGRAGADWLLLGGEVAARHTSYDLRAAAERIRATDDPGARDFAERYVLDPPSEEEMLAAFGGRAPDGSGPAHRTGG